MDLKGYQIILGSKSPRRTNLLQQGFINHKVHAIDVDESYPETLAIETIAEYIAHKKAEAHKDRAEENEIVITADTVVAYKDKVYGKPKSKEDAIKTLLTLSGNTHDVYTGVSIYNNQKQKSFTVTSQVKFFEISQQEAEHYFNQQSPTDKAGSYGIQDWLGVAKVEWINGSYTNILGLPMGQLYQELRSFIASLK